jgi:hypothetical protein
VKKIFDGTCWSLSQEKERIEPLKGRIKVHGLIVNGPGVRLTKGYRNKIRAYRHIINKGGDITNEASLLGHINYADHVSDRLRYVSAIPVENELFQYPDPVDRPAVALETQFSEPSDQSIISRIARLFGISGRNG